jgi:hypothetical protein
MIHREHVFTIGHAYKTLDEGFYVTPGHDLQLTNGEAARYVVRALASFAVQPWPWRMETVSERAFLPEHVLWYCALLLAPIGIAAGLRRDRLATCLLIGVIIPGSSVVALTNGNVGTLIRFRGLVWPYLLVLAALGACVALQWLLQRSNAALTTAKGSLLALERTFSASALVAGGRWAQRAVRNAYDTSQLRAVCIGIQRSWQECESPRVRLAGLALLSFVAVHTALLFRIPSNVAPVMPAGLWLVVALFAAVLITLPDALVRAWQVRRA